MDARRPYAFDQGKAAGAVAANNAGYSVLSGMLALLRPQFDAAGFRVFNCNPRSSLTVFDYVDYESAIEHASGHVPQDPLDTSGWYGTE